MPYVKTFLLDLRIKMLFKMILGEKNPNSRNPQYFIGKMFPIISYQQKN